MKQKHKTPIAPQNPKTPYKYFIKIFENALLYKINIIVRISEIKCQHITIIN